MTKNSRRDSDLRPTKSASVAGSRAARQRPRHAFAKSAAGWRGATPKFSEEHRLLDQEFDDLGFDNDALFRASAGLNSTPARLWKV